MRMVEIEELVRFLRRGKSSEADIRLRFGSCPRKLLKELVSEKLVHKTTNPTRYYATPINKKIKTDLNLEWEKKGIIYSSEDPDRTKVHSFSYDKEDLEKIPVFVKGGIITDPKNGIIHGGTTLPPGVKIQAEERIHVTVPKGGNIKLFEESIKKLWDNPKPKKVGWFKRLLKRNARD